MCIRLAVMRETSAGKIDSTRQTAFWIFRLKKKEASFWWMMMELKSRRALVCQWAASVGCPTCLSYCFSCTPSSDHRCTCPPPLLATATTIIKHQFQLVSVAYISKQKNAEMAWRFMVDLVIQLITKYVRGDERIPSSARSLSGAGRSGERYWRWWRRGQPSGVGQRPPSGVVSALLQGRSGHNQGAT